MTASKDYNKIAPEVAARLQDVEISQAEMKKDILHLTCSVENHLTSAVNKVHEKLDIITPKVEETHCWMQKIQKYVIWPSVALVVTGGLAWFIRLIVIHLQGN